MTVLIIAQWVCQNFTVSVLIKFLKLKPDLLSQDNFIWTMQSNYTSLLLLHQYDLKGCRCKYG